MTIINAILGSIFFTAGLLSPKIAKKVKGVIEERQKRKLFCLELEEKHQQLRERLKNGL